MRFLAVLVAALVAAPALAYAHGGNPAVADLVAPTALCPVADANQRIEWRDADSAAPSGPASIDFFATTVLPPTFVRNVFPPELEDRVVASGVSEPDLENTLVWDTSDVPTGVYWIYSHVMEPPEEMSPELIGLSPVPIVVHHEDDPVPSAVAITRPNSPFAVGDQTYNVRYTALDATGTGRVRLEAKPFNEDDWHLIAENLPASLDGSFQWNTAPLPQGDWVLRATLDDCTGRHVVAHTRFIFLISHPTGPPMDAGADLDAGSVDAVVPDWCDAPAADAGLAQCGVAFIPTSPRDAGVSTTPEEPGGCGCTNERGRSGLLSILGLVGLFVSRSARSRSATR